MSRNKFKTKGRPFLYPGSIDVSDCTTSIEVMEKAGLDFQVGKANIILKMPDHNFGAEGRESSFTRNGFIYDELDGNYGTYRKDKGIPLGLVGNRYEVVQNIAAFNFFDDAIGKDKAIFDRAGYWNNGARIFVSAKLPNNINVNGDVTEEYLVFTNTHDGSSSVEILFTPIRIICQNTLNSAISRAKSCVKFRHTQGVHNKIYTGIELLGITKAMGEETEWLYKELAKIKVDDNEVAAYILNNALTYTEAERLREVDDRRGAMRLVDGDYIIAQEAGISTRKANQVATMFDYYHNGIGQAELVGTGYGLYNMYTGISSNVKNTEGAKRCDDLLYGSSSNNNQKHLNQILANELSELVF